MPNRNTALTSDSILTFMAEYGRAYLSSGGPTSRLEEAMALLGRKLGYPTEVFATPTGIFVSCVDQAGQAHTLLSRISDSGINLGRLCWLEGIFEDVYAGKISLAQGNKILHSRVLQKSPYEMWQFILAAFLSGFALSATAFSMFVPALASGLIAIMAFWLSGPGMKSRISSSIFRDFIGATATLGVAALCQLLMPAPFEAFTIGGLIILVPGLALTTAISELADQNLVSGTAKLMQAILTLLALGLAYMLFHDMSNALSLMPAPSAGPRPQPLGVAAFGIVISVSCFGILFKVPPKSLPWATITGLLGWFILRQFSDAQYIVSASYLASLAVGLVSMGLGTRFKVPSQVFSVPGVLAMLPGMLALTSFRSLALGQQAHAIELGVRVALTAGSIVFGLFTARIPFALLKGRTFRFRLPQSERRSPQG